MFQKLRTFSPLLLGGLGVLALAVIAVVAFGAVTLFRSDSADLATLSPPIPTPASGAKLSPAPVPPSGVFHYVVDQGSKARFVAREQLAVMPTPNNAVGETNKISGDLYLTKAGTVGGPQKSVFKVDLTSLRSDESLRDRAMMGSLGADKFPSAQFALESIEGFPASYTENKEVPLTLKGSMTVRDATKPLNWTAYARRAGEYVTAIADTDIKMTDFGITPPVASITRVEDGVHLQVTLIGKLGQ